MKIVRKGAAIAEKCACAAGKSVALIFPFSPDLCLRSSHERNGFELILRGFQRVRTQFCVNYDIVFTLSNFSVSPHF